MVHPKETVYERSKKNGGFLSGPNHGILKNASKKAANPRSAEVVKTVNAFQDRRRKVQAALDEKYAAENKKSKKGDSNCVQTCASVWIRDPLSDEAVVYEAKGKTYACTYEIDKDECKLGEPFEVESETQYVPKG